jgi:magnesium-transporting ATPase (P-type)
MRAMPSEEQASASAGEKGAPAQQEMHRTIQTAAAAAPVMNAGAAPIAGFGTMANKTSTRALSLYAALLPSGLPAISRATRLTATVALDKAGAVFISTDSGGHWESVARQWSDKAVAVRMQTNTTGVYELVNDKGLVWVSTDGRIWTAK